MILAKVLNKIYKKGGIILEDLSGQKYIIGNPPKDQPIILKLLKNNLKWKLILDPEIEFPEAYMRNEIEIKNQGHPKKSLMKEFFDCVISSETIQHSKNPEEEIDLYYNILKNDGKLIISTSNREAPKKIKDIQSEDMEIKEFSKDEFTDLLSKRFQNIEIFSQRIITQSEIHDSKSLEDIRSREKKRYFFAQIIKKIDPKQKFYSSIVSKIKYSKIINAKEFNLAKEKKPLHQKYLPVMYNEEHEPLFFILVCHKKKMN